MKALVLSSGGVDSTTCLGLAIEKYGKENVIALAITYGQKHTKEIEAAKAVADYYDIEMLHFDLSTIFQYSDCSLLSHSSQEIPEESYSEQLKHSDGTWGGRSGMTVHAAGSSMRCMGHLMCRSLTGGRMYVRKYRENR